jgi:hypothetical protein
MRRFFGLLSVIFCFVASCFAQTEELFQLEQPSSFSAAIAPERDRFVVIRGETVELRSLSNGRILRVLSSPAQSSDTAAFPVTAQFIRTDGSKVLVGWAVTEYDMDGFPYDDLDVTYQYDSTTGQFEKIYSSWTSTIQSDSANRVTISFPYWESEDIQETEVRAHDGRLIRTFPNAVSNEVVEAVRPDLKQFIVRDQLSKLLVLDATTGALVHNLVGKDAAYSNNRLALVVSDNPTAGKVSAVDPWTFAIKKTIDLNFDQLYPVNANQVAGISTENGQKYLTVLDSTLNILSKTLLPVAEVKLNARGSSLIFAHRNGAFRTEVSATGLPTGFVTIFETLPAAPIASAFLTTGTVIVGRNKFVALVDGRNGRFLQTRYVATETAPRGPIAVNAAANRFFLPSGHLFDQNLNLIGSVRIDREYVSNGVQFRIKGLRAWFLDDTTLVVERSIDAGGTVTRANNIYKLVGTSLVLQAQKLLHFIHDISVADGLYAAETGARVLGLYRLSDNAFVRGIRPGNFVGNVLPSVGPISSDVTTGKQAFFNKAGQLSVLYRFEESQFDSDDPSFEQREELEILVRYSATTGKPISKIQLYSDYSQQGEDDYESWTPSRNDSRIVAWNANRLYAVYLSPTYETTEGIFDPVTTTVPGTTRLYRLSDGSSRSFPSLRNPGSGAFSLSGDDFSAVTEQVTNFAISGWTHTVTPSATIVRGGDNVTLAIELRGLALPSGTTVKLATNSPALPVPSSVTVPGRQTMVSVTLTAGRVSNRRVVTLTIGEGVDAKTVTITVDP